MRELQQEVKVAQQNCRSQQTVVQITQKRYETGLVSKLDVAQAQSVYYSTKASLPMLEAGIIQYANSLAILLGLYPSDLQKIKADVHGHHGVLTQGTLNVGDTVDAQVDQARQIGRAHV